MTDSISTTALPMLKRNPLAGDVREALRAYLAVTGLTGARAGDEWTARPFPATKARRDSKRLFTVNVSNMETVHGFYNPISGEDMGGRVHVWHELKRSLPRLESEYDIAALEEVSYKNAQGNARAIYFLDLPELERLLRDREIAAACAKLVTYLLRNEQNPGMQRRWHDPAFAAWILTNAYRFPTSTPAETLH